MALAEGVAARVAYKAYASGIMNSNSEPDPAVEPGSTGGRILRRTSANLNLAKDSSESNENRTDRQRADMRHQARRTQGPISGEFSPATYFDFIEAVHRDTAIAVAAKTKTEFTSIAASATASTITLGGGDPVSQGFRVGDIVRLTGLAVTANNGKNFLITGFSGTGNRTVAVYPAPADISTPDTGSWTMTRPGKATAAASANHVKRRFAFEIFNEDIGAGRLFTECRMGGYRLNLPVSGMNTFETNMTGRGMKILKGASAPFFTAPAQPTTTGVTSLDGVVLLNGQRIGLLQSLDLTATLNASTADVRAQKFAAEVFLAKYALNGNMSLFLENMNMVEAFDQEQELEVITSVFSDATDAAEGCGLHLPRIKLSSADINTDGEGGQVVTAAFTALRYLGSKPGVEQTTFRMHDTAAA